MDSPQTIYRNMPGPVGDCLRPASLSTTAIIPVSESTSLVVTTGHIGLDLSTCALINDTIEHELNAIFSCLDAALRDAGATNGLRAAYKFTSYLTSAAHEPIMQEVFKRRWPGHSPTWTTVFVSAIIVPDAHAEIVAEGVIYKGAGV